MPLMLVLSGVPALESAVSSAMPASDTSCLEFSTCHLHLCFCRWFCQYREVHKDTLNRTTWLLKLQQVQFRWFQVTTGKWKLCCCPLSQVESSVDYIWAWSAEVSEASHWDCLPALTDVNHSVISGERPAAIEADQCAVFMCSIWIRLSSLCCARDCGCWPSRGKRHIAPHNLEVL